jgi:hypothetical protein
MSALTNALSQIDFGGRGAVGRTDPAWTGDKCEPKVFNTGRIIGRTKDEFPIYRGVGADVRKAQRSRNYKPFYGWSKKSAGRVRG